MAHPVAFFEANPAAGVDELQSDHAGAFYSLSSTPLPAMWPLAATVVIVIPCVFAVIAVSPARHDRDMVGMVLVAQKLPPPARGQTRAELKLMHHRGIAFFNAEDQRICCDPHWMPAFLVQLAADATADAMVMRLLTAIADSVT